MIELNFHAIIQLKNLQTKTLGKRWENTIYKKIMVQMKIDEGIL